MLTFKSQQLLAQHCCLRNDLFEVDQSNDIWKDQRFYPLRKTNTNNQWDPGCNNCENLEKNHMLSFRQGMNKGLGILGRTDLEGPARIDLMFDISCNLACRTCGAHSSTFWQRHLKEHGLWTGSIAPQQKKHQVIETLQKLNLSNLRQLVFCGGETLLGEAYWDVARWLSENVPNAKQNLTLCFQTNGTQDINPKYYEIIEKFYLVKLHISLDGVDEQFDYLRWPANWHQVTDNILALKQNLPGNVMFVVEETVSIFNLNYLEKLQKWTAENFHTSREGDVINHTRHMAKGIFTLSNCSQEYVEAVKKSSYADLVPANWQENPQQIHAMMAEIKRYDQFRNQSFQSVFPEVAQYYARFG